METHTEWLILKITEEGSQYLTWDVFMLLCYEQTLLQNGNSSFRVTHYITPSEVNILRCPFISTREKWLPQLHPSRIMTLIQCALHKYRHLSQWHALIGSRGLLPNTAESKNFPATQDLLDRKMKCSDWLPCLFVLEELRIEACPFKPHA